MLLCDTHTLVASVLFKVCMYFVRPCEQTKLFTRTGALASLFPPPYLLAVVAGKCLFAVDNVPILFRIYRLYRRVRFILLRTSPWGSDRLRLASRSTPTSWKKYRFTLCPNFSSLLFGRTFCPARRLRQPGYHSFSDQS